MYYIIIEQQPKKMKKKDEKKNDLLDKTEELNKIFGKFEISAPVLPTNFDKTWSPYTGEVRMKYPKKKKYSKNINNF